VRHPADACRGRISASDIAFGMHGLIFHAKAARLPRVSPPAPSAVAGFGRPPGMARNATNRVRGQPRQTDKDQSRPVFQRCFSCTPTGLARGGKVLIDTPFGMKLVFHETRSCLKYRDQPNARHPCTTTSIIAIRAADEMSMSPTSTARPKAIGLVLPSCKGKPRRTVRIRVCRPRNLLGDRSQRSWPFGAKTDAKEINGR